jgi:hypothetical protein
MSKNKKNQVDHILSTAQQNGLEIDSTDVKINESGVDFLAVFAKTKDGVLWVLRAPRRPDVVESAAYEKKVLDLIASRLPVAVPNWQVHTPELIAYPMLEGTPAATINPEAKNYDWYMNQESLPAEFVRSLAEAMAALHGIDGNHGLPTIRSGPLTQRSYMATYTPGISWLILLDELRDSWIGPRRRWQILLWTLASTTPCSVSLAYPTCSSATKKLAGSYGLGCVTTSVNGWPPILC